MRNIYTTKNRTPLLDRLALFSAIAIVGIVAVDLVFWKDIIGFQNANISGIVETSSDDG